MNEQKPVTYVALHDDGFISYGQSEPRDDLTPLYTHPAPSWQGLSDDEIQEIFGDEPRDELLLRFTRSIEQALKEKNGR